MALGKDRLIRDYYKGILTLSEITDMLLRSCEPEELADLPPEIDVAVRERVQQAPTSDEDWNQLITIRSWCGPWDEEIAARQKERDRRDKQHYRRVVEALRSAMIDPDTRRVH